VQQCYAIAQQRIQDLLKGVNHGDNGGSEGRDPSWVRGQKVRGAKPPEAESFVHFHTRRGQMMAKVKDLNINNNSPLCLRQTAITYI